MVTFLLESWNQIIFERDGFILDLCEASEKRGNFQASWFFGSVRSFLYCLSSNAIITALLFIMKPYIKQKKAKNFIISTSLEA